MGLLNKTFTAAMQCLAASARVFFKGGRRQPVGREASNPSIERTSQRPLRALCAAAHIER